jgi:Fe-S oxidoreductase
VLEQAGLSSQCRSDACCGLTWISTGQLDRAKKTLTKAAKLLDDGTDRPIVVLEPSCAAALRKDLPELVHTDAARRVAARVQSFAGAVLDRVAAGWQPSAALPEDATVQAHCHEYAVFGAATQRKALQAVGVARVREATGCCGVAGNFGFEDEHYDVSMQVAEQALAPALRATPDEAAVLTDGFSCHMQVRQLEPSRKSMHLAELLDPGP